MDPLARQAVYSPSGSLAAKNALESLQGAESWKEKISLLNDGFQSINDSPLTTRDEKALASLGKSLVRELRAGTVADEESPVLAMSAVMDALAHSQPGPLGSIVAGISLSALDSMSLGMSVKNCLSFLKTGTLGLSRLKKDYAGEILENGFTAILSNPRASKEEAALSQFGSALSPLEARAAVMQSILHPAGGPLASVIAQAALLAERRCDSFGSVHVLACGFSAIKDNREVPEAVRIRAEEGYSAHPDDFAPDPIEERKAMLPFMKDIPGLAVQEAEHEEVRRMTEEKQELETMIDDINREAAPVDVEDDFVNIDGVRLGRQNHR
jgi:hypothetical protein